MADQQDCKNDFVKLLNEFISRIDEIDKATPWSEVEPNWWLEMMDYRSKAVDTIEEMTK